MKVGIAQSTGIERSHNEDTLFALHGSGANQPGLPEFGLFIVADGMGGHRAGEIASAISVRKVAQFIIQQSFLHLFDPQNTAEIPPLQELMREALEAANQAVVERVPGGGTTLTAAVVLGHQVTLGHVGDSRAYFISPEDVRVITRDHSLVERLKELGQLSDEEAAIHPQRNVLYRAIGQGSNLEVDVSTQSIPNNAYMLLCSDGLWNVVPEDRIKQIVLETGDPQTACDLLVQEANAAGGPDNITAILVYFPQE
jgi:protein phosphatase